MNKKGITNYVGNGTVVLEYAISPNEYLHLIVSDVNLPIIQTEQELADTLEKYNLPDLDDKPLSEVEYLYRDSHYVLVKWYDKDTYEPYYRFHQLPNEVYLSIQKSGIRDIRDYADITILTNEKGFDGIKSFLNDIISTEYRYKKEAGNKKDFSIDDMSNIAIKKLTIPRGGAINDPKDVLKNYVIPKNDEITYMILMGRINQGNRIVSQNLQRIEDFIDEHNDDLDTAIMYSKIGEDLIDMDMFYTDYALYLFDGSKMLREFIIPKHLFEQENVDVKLSSLDLTEED